MASPAPAHVPSRAPTLRKMFFAVVLLLTLIAANVCVSQLRIRGEELPDYATWTGIVTLERKLRLLRDFARQGEVDALVLSSSIGDYGVSAEVLSRELSSAGGKAVRVFNFSTGGADAPTYPMLYRLARLVAKPKRIWIAYPVEHNIGDNIRKQSPEYTMSQAPVGVALRQPALLPLSFAFFDLPLVRHAAALRDGVVYGHFTHRPISHADSVELSSHGDSRGFLYYPDAATLRRFAHMRRERVLDLARQYAIPELDDRQRRDIYFSAGFLQAIAEMRSLAAQDNCPIQLIPHDQAAGFASQDAAYLEASQPFYRLLSQYYGAQVLDVRASFVPEHYKYSDYVHLNGNGAAEFSTLLAAHIANRSTPQRVDYVVSSKIREGAPDPKLTNHTVVLVRRRSEPAGVLELRYLQNLVQPRLTPYSQVRLAVRLPNNQDVVIPARVIARGRVLADTSALSLPEKDQVLLAQLIRPRGKMGEPLNIPLTSYRWSGDTQPPDFYEQQVVTVSAEATSYTPLDAIRTSWKQVGDPAPQDWIGVFPVGGGDQTRLSFEFTGGGTHGTLELPPVNTPPGQYELRFFRNGSWDIIATSKPFMIVGLSGNVEVPVKRVKAGGSVRVRWSKLSSPRKDDWMGLFPRRGADNARLEFRLLGGKGEGLIDFPVPISAPLGEYEIRLYSSGGYTFIGRSTPFEVLPPNVYLKALQPAVKAGGVIRVRWSGVDSPAKDDWIGVFPKSGQDTARLLFQKTGGFASGELSFGIPAGTTAGEYEFRFYSNGSWQMARTSDPFRVEATSVRLEIRPVQLKQGESLTISWTGIDYPSKDDWIGLFQNGDLAKRIWFTTLGGKPSGEIDWADSRMAPPGAYEAALFSAGGWQKLAHRALTILPARTVDGGFTGGQSPIRR